jgi:hypothetical protein
MSSSLLIVRVFESEEVAGLVTFHVETFLRVKARTFTIALPSAPDVLIRQEKPHRHSHRA